MIKKAPDLVYIEESFASIKSNQNGDTRQEINAIARTLKRRYNLDVNIRIIDNAHSEFFGMSIYPDKSAIDHIVDEMVDGGSRLETIEKIWAKNNRWTIEIDTKLLYDIKLNANPKEITAVLLHEIGHTVFSNSIPARVHKVLSYALMKIPVKVKKVFTWSKAQRLLGLAIIEACSLTSFNTTGTKVEVEADKFAIKEGYANDLNSFMDKLLRAEGNKYFDITNNEAEKDIAIMVEWAVVNTSELQYRKTKLKNSINNEVRVNRSLFTREYLMDIRNEFFGDGTRTRYDELVSEQRLDKHIENLTNVTEGFRDWFSKRGEIKRVQQSDIDIITIEINRIENEDDRLYVLDLIYDKLDLIETSLDLLKTENHRDKVKVSKTTLEDQRDQLNKLRSDVLKLKVTPIKYGVLIRYPDGYEG